MTVIHARRRNRHLPVARRAATLRRVNPTELLPEHDTAPPAVLRDVALQVNAREVGCRIAAHVTLAQLLRDELGLTGTKVACDQAACGACTVLLDGEPVFACHTLAAQALGAQVVTIEGLAAADGALDPLQQAFVDHDALQCGFCTPGMLMALKGALAQAARAGTTPGRDEIARAISGNLCRCGAYPHIIEAALDVVARR